MFFDIMLSALRAAFVWAVPKVAVMFGIYVISATVYQPILDRFKSVLMTQLSSSGQYLQYFELLGVNDFITIIFSAYTLHFAIKAGKSGLGAK